jgi:hypothetical protein
MTVRVYQYGTVPPRVAPIIGEDVANEQLRLSNRLWNTLVAIERTRMERYKRIMYDASQEQIEKLQLRVGVLREEIRLRRKSARSRSVDLSDVRPALEASRADLRTAIDQQKSTAASRHDAKRAELTALSERTKHRIKRARQAAASMGLFWGTYNDIVGRADTGRKAGDLQFRRFSGDGTLTAQIMGGATVARCSDGGHGFFQIGAAVIGQKWRYARMRIGSNPDRSPVWLEIPIVLHRPIPEESAVKSVSMTRRNGRWTLNVTVTMESPAQRTDGAEIAVDLGYRLKPEGVRVAYWANSTGTHGEVLVSSSDICQLERVHSLRSICDRSRDEFLPVLAEWLADRVLTSEWMTKTTALSQWRSSDRIAALIRWWADKRLADDEEIFSAAREWRKNYLHLANWWRNLEDQLHLRLREQYRRFAAGIAKTYRVLYIEDFDLREVAEKPMAESDEPRTASARYRQMVGPSVFRHALINACLREGVAVVKLPAEYTTRTCHSCGYAGEWDQAATISHRCERCGTLFDQDHNAALNLLTLGHASGAVLQTDNQQDRVRKWDRVRERSQKLIEHSKNEALAR